MNDGVLARLRQLHTDLHVLAANDPDQEVTDRALVLLDKALSDAKPYLDPDSDLLADLSDYLSPEAVEAREAPRAADAVVVVGQVLAALSPSGLIGPPAVVASSHQFSIPRFATPQLDGRWLVVRGITLAPVALDQPESFRLSRELRSAVPDVLNIARATEWLGRWPTLMPARLRPTWRRAAAAR